MKQLGVGYTGTVTKNRIENCPVGKEMATKRGSLDFMTDKNTKILVCCWNDNKFVNYLIRKFGAFYSRNYLFSPLIYSITLLSRMRDWLFFKSNRHFYELISFSLILFKSPSI